MRASKNHTGTGTVFHQPLVDFHSRLTVVPRLVLSLLVARNHGPWLTAARIMLCVPPRTRTDQPNPQTRSTREADSSSEPFSHLPVNTISPKPHMHAPNDPPAPRPMRNVPIPHPSIKTLPPHPWGLPGLPRPRSRRRP